jgi:purine-binding chemotaxis protein CheW
MPELATKKEVNQYLTFRLGDEEYAIDVSNIREILEYSKITKIPCTHEYMQGVINLRGNVVPVINFHLKFGMDQTEHTVDTCIIVMEVKINNDLIFLGAIADSVEEVIELDHTQIEPAPEIGTKLNREFIKGIGKRNDKFIIIIDIDEAFSEEELDEVTSAGRKGTGTETQESSQDKKVKAQKEEPKNTQKEMDFASKDDKEDRTIMK